jgi:hypothetical protein
MWKRDKKERQKEKRRYKRRNIRAYKLTNKNKKRER